MEITKDKVVVDGSLDVLVEGGTPGDKVAVVKTIAPFTARYFESREQHKTYATFQNGDSSTPHRP